MIVKFLTENFQLKLNYHLNSTKFIIVVAESILLLIQNSHHKYRYYTKQSLSVVVIETISAAMHMWFFMTQISQHNTKIEHYSNCIVIFYYTELLQLYLKNINTKYDNWICIYTGIGTVTIIVYLQNHVQGLKNQEVFGQVIIIIPDKT